MVNFLYTPILKKCVSTYFVKICVTKLIQGVVAEGAKVLGFIYFFLYLMTCVSAKSSNLGKKCKDRFRGSRLLAKKAL